MARANTLMLAAAAAQLLPIATALFVRTGVRGPRLWITAWFVLGASFDILARTLARGAANNHWLAYLVAPVMGVVALRAMVSWQRHELARIAVWLMIPLSLLAWLLLLVTVEDSTTFSRVVRPMFDLLCLGVAVFTMGSRGLHDETPILRQGWFWFCGGFALYYGAAAAVSPLGALLVGTRPDLVVRALTMQAAIDIVAYLLVSIGFLCRPPTPSGAWSSPSPSRWPSSWSPSERPS